MPRYVVSDSDRQSNFILNLGANFNYALYLFVQRGFIITSYILFSGDFCCLLLGQFA